MLLLPMRLLPYLLLVILGFNAAGQDNEASPPEGIIILKDVAGSPAAAVTFVSIQWTSNFGGYVVDAAGNKTPFIREGIGRIVYFDQGYYEGVDHNQYWVDWRAGIQSHEVVVPPVDKVGLRQEDLSRLRSEQAVLEDTVGRYPVGRGLIDPIIALLKEDTANLSNGLVLQNGTWLSAKDATAQSVAPVVGEGDRHLTFTTKDGKEYAGAKVVVTDTGISVLTSDGGASVPFDKLPDDLSKFPAAVRSQIETARAKIKADADAAAAAAAATAPATPASTSKTSFWDDTEAFLLGVLHKVESYFSSSSSTSSSPSSDSTNSSSVAVPVPEAGDIAKAVVLIKGDIAQGTGFLTKTADGPVIITNLHVIAGNPNIKILTAGGEQIIPLSLKGASDRDIAMFSIQDNHYSYLELASNVDGTAVVGDPTLIPGDSEGGEVTLKTNGKLVAVGPQRIEFDNPIYHGNSGGPVYDSNSHKVIGVVVGASQMKPTNEVDKDSFANANSAIKGPMRYFGLRVDTVPSWEPYSLEQLERESLFLKDFHEQSRALDSFINGHVSENYNISSEEGRPDPNYYTRSEKLRRIFDNLNRTTETQGRAAALQECLWDLQTEVDEGFESVQNNHSFYAYNRPMAQQEFEYRKALREELLVLQTRVKSVSPGGDIKL